MTMTAVGFDGFEDDAADDEAEEEAAGAGAGGEAEGALGDGVEDMTRRGSASSLRELRQPPPINSSTDGCQRPVTAAASADAAGAGRSHVELDRVAVRADGRGHGGRVAHDDRPAAQVIARCGVAGPQAVLRGRLRPRPHVRAAARDRARPARRLAGDGHVDRPARAALAQPARRGALAARPVPQQELPHDQPVQRARLRRRRLARRRARRPLSLRRPPPAGARRDAEAVRARRAIPCRGRVESGAPRNSAAQFRRNSCAATAHSSDAALARPFRWRFTARLASAAPA